MDHIREMDKRLVIIPIPDNVLFPGGTLSLRLQGDQSDGVIDFLENKKNFAVCFTFKGKREDNDLDLEDIGTLARIEWERGQGNYWDLTLIGMERVQKDHVVAEPGRLVADFDFLDDHNDLEKDTSKAMLDSIKELSEDILELIEEDGRIRNLVKEFSDLSTLMNFCAQNMNISFDQKQELLEELSLKNRGLKILDLLSRQKDNIELQIEMSNKVADSTNKIHRENLLREQIRAIKDELGEGSSNVVEDYRKRINESGMPEEVLLVALEELERLDAQSPHSPETNGIRNYLDTLLALPWKDPEEQDIDLAKARAVLEEDHYGLEEIKERIIQDLAVLKMKKNKKGALLLFVGPPGVGKTSLGKSIARALGREFTRTSLGGVRDESEIKGHRRTYLGALPGRIIQNLKRLETRNPVFLLDEIDKLAKGWSGDPAASLLEVLDPEQNNTFVDHFLDVPYDLSEVFFIGTANSTDTIPGPLLDRMEVIRLSGYTDVEKKHIALNHLIPKQLEEHGIEADKVVFSEEIVEKIISTFTREAGVRNLQRKIAALCRISAVSLLEEKGMEKKAITDADLDEHLGKERVEHDAIEDHGVPGVANGLAWTPFGGEILFVETNSVPGKGNLTLTGQLGDVMKESAKIAITLIRSHIPKVAKNFQFDESDIHIHVPAGATPKDGPSAGIALLAALTSLVTGKVLEHTTALTGEITLRGAILPVGGIKEKFLAAHRAGVRKIFMSEKNSRDLKDLPEAVLKALEIVKLQRVEDLFAQVFGITVKLPHMKSWGSKPSAGM
jgi:ATP-dependent Lon protease